MKWVGRGRGAKCCRVFFYVCFIVCLVSPSKSFKVSSSGSYLGEPDVNLTDIKIYYILEHGVGWNNGEECLIILLI